MKQWEKPTLVILVRGKPEERILSSCKSESGIPAGANILYGSCYFSDIPTVGCTDQQACASVANS